MIQRNRRIATNEIGHLALDERVSMEAEITDARAASLELEQFRSLDLGAWARVSAWRRHLLRHLGDVRGKRLLDICCGYSMTPVLFALAGAEVVAVDVAPLALEKVMQVAKMHNLGDRLSTHCGPVERLPFADGSFDLIFGGAAIHHLQLETAGRELARLLRPGGRGGFQDPLGHNRLLEFARDNLSYHNKHPDKGTDKPLMVPDIHTFGKQFASYSWRGFELVTMISRAHPAIRRVRPALENVDSAIFAVAPFLQRYARFSVTCVTK